MYEKLQVVNQDLIPDVTVHTRKDIEGAHNTIEMGNHPALTVPPGEAPVLWIVKPFVGVTYYRTKEEIRIGLKFLTTEVASTVLSAEKLGETLTFDAFIAKAKIYVGYATDKTAVVFKGTACYRKLPALEWRCVTTGEKTLFHF